MAEQWKPHAELQTPSTKKSKEEIMDTDGVCPQGHGFDAGRHVAFQVWTLDTNMMPRLLNHNATPPEYTARLLTQTMNGKHGHD